MTKTLASPTGRPAHAAARRGPALVLWALGAWLAAGPAQAQEFKVSGFASAVAVKTSGGCQPTLLAPAFQNNCTRYIVDWAHAAVATDKWGLNRESRAGVQGEWQLDPQWSAVAQITARTLQDQHVKLEWAYVTYAPTPEWKLQVGRKRIPLYYYSDFQDVGFAYNTVRPSPDVYGWDVVNYNGANISTNRSLGDWHLRAEAYAGTEDSRKNPYSRLGSTDPVDVKWSGITGAAVEFGRDWFTGRLSYTRSNYESRDHASGSLQALLDGSTRAKQEFLGLALNGDWDDWQLRSEFGTAQRMKALGYNAKYFLLTLSRQFGAFTVTGGASGYRENSDYPLASYSPVKLSASLLGLRYDVHKGGALKLQFDRVRDTSVQTYTGKATVSTLAYDVVF